MTLVFGGAYMGKQDYAKAHLGAGEIEQCGATCRRSGRAAWRGWSGLAWPALSRSGMAAAALEAWRGPVGELYFDRPGYFLRCRPH